MSRGEVGRPHSPRVPCAVELAVRRDTRVLDSWGGGERLSSRTQGVGSVLGGRLRPSIAQGAQIQPLPVAQPGSGGSPVGLSGTGGGREVTSPGFIHPRSLPDWKERERDFRSPHL